MKESQVTVAWRMCRVEREADPKADHKTLCRRVMKKRKFEQTTQEDLEVAMSKKLKGRKTSRTKINWDDERRVKLFELANDAMEKHPDWTPKHLFTWLSKEATKTLGKYANYGSVRTQCHDNAKGLHTSIGILVKNRERLFPRTKLPALSYVTKTPPHDGHPVAHPEPEAKVAPPAEQFAKLRYTVKFETDATDVERLSKFMEWMRGMDGAEITGVELV